MATLKYSRQREAIKDYLATSRSHPTADMVYMHVKKEFPNISLGTVYRNLNLLSDLGEILKLTTPDGGDRFDGQTHDHYHFHCRSCGCVYDIEVDPDTISQINDLASSNFDGTIESHSLLFSGICSKCSKLS